jgi:hypothetical protein
MRQSVEVQAVHDSDLQNVLSHLGILEDVLEGRFDCAVCEQPVTLDNLGTVVPSEGVLRATCDLPRCVRTVTAASAARRRDRGRSGHLGTRWKAKL